ncbi:MAG: hypothetical protein WCP64_05895 [Actinomycetes bacterium]|jgi:predicted RNA-binding Zn-ribbon protein involved in translation (DUF1610 family)
MFTKKEQPWRCRSCKKAIAIDAYYCKNCGALVSVELAPEAREVDTSFKIKLVRLWQMRAIAKITWALIILISLASGSYFANTIRIARVDNHSSAALEMKVDQPSNPFQCTGPICQATVEIINKTNSEQHLTGTPYFKLDDGKLYGPINMSEATSHLYFASTYCTQKFDLRFAPKESKKFIGICTETFPPTGIVKGIQIQDAAGKLALSVNLSVSVPQKF